MKEGIDYFPLYVAMDERIELLEADFGIKGFGIFVKLRQRIADKHGYYAEWSDKIAKIFGKRINESASLVSEVVNAAIRENLFDETMYQDFGILTSREIQEEYLGITKRRNNGKGGYIENRYSLVHGEQNSKNACKNAKNVSRNAKNVCNSSQRKVKESKVKQSRVKNIYMSDSADIVGADAPHFDYQLYADYWNHHVAEPTGIAAIRKADKWSSTRKKNLRARVKAEGAKTVLEVFDLVSASDFLSGRSGKWQADFDWVLKDGNFQKIIEGKFNNRKQPDHETFYDRLARGEI